MVKIAYAVVQWREAEVPDGTVLPNVDGWGFARNPEALLAILASLGVLTQTDHRWHTTDGLEVASDNEYGYDEYVRIQQ